MLGPMRSSIAGLVLLVVCLLAASAHARKTAELPRARWERLLRRLGREVARLRGSRLRPPKLELISRAQLKAQLATRLDRSMTPAELAAEEAVLKQLGLLPTKASYRAAVLALLAEQVAGSYDPRRKVLTIPRWLSPETQRSALVHELCHALQDQHLRLSHFTRPFKQDSDRRLARLALIEGECMGLMLEHALRKTGSNLSNAGALVDALLARGGPYAESSRLAQAPPFLRHTLLFPYQAGLRYVQRLRHRNSWAVVSLLYRRPPETTERILHPGRRAKRREVRVQARKLPALAGWRRIKLDTWGEALLAATLEPTLAREAAARAAEGWGGDRLAAYVPKDPSAAAKAKAAKAVRLPPPIVVHMIALDTEIDAQELENAELRVLQARFGATPAAAENTTANVYVYQMPGGREASLQRYRKVVLLIVGAPAALRAQLQREVWSRWSVGGRHLRPR